MAVWNKKPAPPKDWLANEYLLPPRGKGRTLTDIASECNCDPIVVRRWVAEYGLTEDAKVRYAYIRKVKGNPKRRKPRPPKVELARLYLMPPDGEGLTLDEIGKRYDTDRQIVAKWLKSDGLTQDFSLRHSIRMAGENNPAYTSGDSQRYHLNKLTRTEPDKVCGWCGTSEDIQVHHIDHDTTNDDINNLMWLCRYCNCMEAWMFNLIIKGRVTVEQVESNNTMKIILTFNKEGET